MIDRIGICAELILLMNRYRQKYEKHFYTHLGKHFVKIAFVSVLGLISVSCSDDIRTDGFSTNDIPELLPLSNVQKEILAYLPKDCIIAHRGTEFWAPEESEAAMRWARNMGADYLECDVQRTKDGVVLALHDESLLRTTDVEVIYPNRQNDYVSAFTYEELLKLDIGSWFKDANPEQWRESFRGLEIITVQDVIKIAEGYRFKRWGKDTNGVLDGHRYGERMYDKIQLPDGKVKYDFKYVEDEADNGNRPGIYVETKSPSLFSGVEQDLHDIFVEYGWYHDDINQLKRIPYKTIHRGWLILLIHRHVSFCRHSPIPVSKVSILCLSVPFLMHTSMQIWNRPLLLMRALSTLLLKTVPRLWLPILTMLPVIQAV